MNREGAYLFYPTKTEESGEMQVDAEGRTVEKNTIGSAPENSDPAEGYETKMRRLGPKRMVSRLAEPQSAVDPELIVV